jgi:serine/threonine-protein kinase
MMQVPKTAQEHVRYGNELLATPWRKGFADKAIEQFQLAVKIDEKHASAHAGLSVAYWRKFRQSNDHTWLDRATANAEHAVELDPQLAAARIALGTAKISRGDLDAAREQLDKAIALDPANASAHRWLADIAAKSKDNAAAEAGLRKALALRPLDPELINALGSFLYAAGRYDEAARHFQRSIDLAPDNMASYRNLSAVLHQKGDFPGAARVLQRSLEIEPNPTAYSNLGTLYFFQGLYPQSVNAFEKAVELGANTHVLWANLGDAYRWTPGNEQKAREAFGTALNLLEDELRGQPENEKLLSRKALYLAKQGEAAAASKIADRLIRDERDPQNLYRLGLAYELTGSRDKSLATLENAVRRGYSSEELRSDPELTSLRSDVRYHQMMLAVRDRP